MTGFERITVLIEHVGTGRTLLHYVKELSRLAHTREIDLLHVVPFQPSLHIGAIPVEGSGYWISTEAIRQRDEQVAFKKNELERLAKEFRTPGLGCDVRTTVLYGSPLFETLEYTLQTETDLLVVGRHFAGDGLADEHATMARRLTQKSACSVLVLPERTFSFPTRILVPVRNSECSAQALEVACLLAAPTSGLVFALNLYSPRTSATTSLALGGEPPDFPETKARDENSALRERVDNHGVYVEYLTGVDPENHPQKKMLEAVEQTNAHAVVIGARGRTGAAGVLLGKVTERLIAESAVPVFAVKKKGEMIGVLRAILALAGKKSGPSLPEAMGDVLG